jgi:hypothetical protein
MYFSDTFFPQAASSNITIKPKILIAPTALMIFNLNTGVLRKTHAPLVGGS